MQLNYTVLLPQQMGQPVLEKHRKYWLKYINRPCIILSNPTKWVNMLSYLWQIFRWIHFNGIRHWSMAPRFFTHFVKHLNFGFVSGKIVSWIYFYHLDHFSIFRFPVRVSQFGRLFDSLLDKIYIRVNPSTLVIYPRKQS